MGIWDNIPICYKDTARFLLSLGVVLLVIFFAILGGSTLYFFDKFDGYSKEAISLTAQLHENSSSLDIEIFNQSMQLVQVKIIGLGQLTKGSFIVGAVLGFWGILLICIGYRKLKEKENPVINYSAR